ncbi:MAG TPA: hypothetical protein VIT41_08100 [Microlunatus sp.]
MTSEEPRAGLLIMRVERQDDYLLIALTVEPSLLDQPIGAPARHQVRLTDRSAALEIIHRFLDSF